MLGGNYLHPASPVDFHPASIRKIRHWYLTFRSLLRLHISPIKKESQCWLLWVIKITENQPQAANSHAMTRHFPDSAMIDAGRNFVQHHCLRGVDGLIQKRHYCYVSYTLSQRIKNWHQSEGLCYLCLCRIQSCCVTGRFCLSPLVEHHIPLLCVPA